MVTANRLFSAPTVTDADRQFFHENGMTGMHEYYYEDSPSPEFDDLRICAEYLANCLDLKSTQIKGAVVVERYKRSEAAVEFIRGVVDVEKILSQAPTPRIAKLIRKNLENMQGVWW